MIKKSLIAKEDSYIGFSQGEKEKKRKIEITA